jgi:hypothetical protein
MVAAWNFLPTLSSSSPLPPPWLSLSCRLVVVSTPLPLVLSTLPLPQPLPINTPPSLVCWHISSRLPLFAGWLLCRLLLRRLRLASSFVTQPSLATIINPPSSFALAGCFVKSRHTASTSQCATGSHLATCGTSALHPPAHPLLHCNFCRPLS